MHQCKLFNSLSELNDFLKEYKTQLTVIDITPIIPSVEIGVRQEQYFFIWYVWMGTKIDDEQAIDFDNIHHAKSEFSHAPIVINPLKKCCIQCKQYILKNHPELEGGHVECSTCHMTIKV